MSTPPQTRRESPKPAPRKKVLQPPSEGAPATRPSSPLAYRPTATTRDDIALHTSACANAAPVRRSGSFQGAIFSAGKEPPLARELWRLPKSGKTSSLAKFVETHLNDFPMCVAVTGGTQIGLSVGSIYTVHFVKNTKVINAEDGKGVPQFCIPLNSSVQIGIVHPTLLNSENQKCCNVIYKSAKEVMCAEPLPKILRVANGYVDSNPLFTLAQNELLIVKRVLKSQRPFGQQKLMTYSLTNNAPKVLRESCNALFLTEPESVLVYPVEFFAHFNDSLPLKAILQFANNVPKSSPAEVITLTDWSVVRSIIVTPYRGKDSPPQLEGEVTPLLEIPLDSNVELDKATIQENEDMCSESLTLIRDFDPKRVTSMMPHAGPGGCIRPGYEREGLELESILISPSRPPANLPQTEGPYSIPLDCVQLPKPKQRVMPSADAAEVKVSNGSADLRVQFNTLQRTVEIVQCQMDSVENMARRSHNWVGLLKAEMAELTKATKQLTARVDALALNKNGLRVPSPKREASQETSLDPTLHSTTSSADREKNKKLLAKLSCEEVKLYTTVYRYINAINGVGVGAGQECSFVR